MKRILAVICFAAGLLPALPAAAITLGEPGSPLGPRSQLTVGTGVMSFFDGGTAGTSAAWEVRYGFFFPSNYLALEAGYTGGVGEATAPGAMVTTILDGDVRFNPFPSASLSPYVLAGAGWGAFSGTSVQSDNGTVVIPMGAGADYHISDRLLAGGRFTYRLTVADQVGPLHASADNWALTARVGAQF